MNNSELTILDLAQELRLSTRAIEKNIKKLQEAGKLRRKGPANGGHWVVLVPNS